MNDGKIQQEVKSGADSLPAAAPWPDLEEWLPWRSWRDELEAVLRKAAAGAGASPWEVEELLREAEAHACEAWEQARKRRLQPPEAWEALRIDLGAAAGWSRAFARPSEWWKGKIMRRTLLATSAAALCFLGALGVTPTDAPPPTLRTAQADEPAANKAEPATEEQTAQRLNSLVDVDIEDAPLTDVIDFLRTTAEIQFFLHRQSVEQVLGAVGETKVTLQLKRIKASTALDLALQQCGDGGLGYYAQDGIVFITGTGDPRLLERQLEVRVYNCRDLLRIPALPKKHAPEEAADGADARALAAKALKIVEQRLADESAAAFAGGVVPGESAELIRVLQSAGPAQDWEENGGTASIKAFNGLMTIRTKPEIHRNIESLLKMLRESVKDELGK